MNDLDENLSVRGCEKLGLIGNNTCSALIDKKGGVLWATFKKFILKSIYLRARLRPDVDLLTDMQFLNKFLTIEWKDREETKQYYVRDTAILVTKMKSPSAEIMIYVFIKFNTESIIILEKKTKKSKTY